MNALPEHSPESRVQQMSRGVIALSRTAMGRVNDEIDPGRSGTSRGSGEHTLVDDDEMVVVIGELFAYP